ncbi:MAG: hypothetical protein IJU91_01120 [Selenomonadaceae bacterium]|nr:hypothetical protein [Selenomonadaceae bacterium]
MMRLRRQLRRQLNLPIYLTGYSYDESSVSLQFADGGSLHVESTSMVGYKVEETTYAFNHASGEWLTSQ